MPPLPLAHCCFRMEFLKLPRSVAFMTVHQKHGLASCQFGAFHSPLSCQPPCPSLAALLGNFIPPHPFHFSFSLFFPPKSHSVVKLFLWSLTPWKTRLVVLSLQLGVLLFHIILIFFLILSLYPMLHCFPSNAPWHHCLDRFRRETWGMEGKAEKQGSDYLSRIKNVEEAQREVW